jgi:hypothetical protein
VEEAGTKEVGKLMKEVGKLMRQAPLKVLCILWNQMELDQKETCGWMEVMVCVNAEDMDRVE